MWTCYRAATKQLNLYYTDRAVDNSCKKFSQCAGLKNDITTHFLGLFCCWSMPATNDTPQYKWYCGGSGNYKPLAPLCKLPISPALDRLFHRIQKGFWELQARRNWIKTHLLRLKFPLSSQLWENRNAAMSRSKLSTPASRSAKFWAFVPRHLKAIAIRENRSAATTVGGACLHA